MCLLVVMKTDYVMMIQHSKICCADCGTQKDIIQNYLKLFMHKIIFMFSESFHTLMHMIELV